MTACMNLPAVLDRRLAEAGLDPAAVEAVVAGALAEDLAGGVDVTSVAVIAPDDVAVADFVSRARGVVAGLPIASAVLWIATEGTVDIDERVVDGMRVEPATTVLVGNGRDARAAHRRAHRTESARASVGHRHPHPCVGRCHRGQRRRDP